MNDKKIDIDQLFNSRLSEAEEAFDPNAWEQMQQKLDKNDNRKGGLILIPNIRRGGQKIKTITIMTTLIASVVAISIYNYSPLQNTEISSNVIRNSEQTIMAKANPSTPNTIQNAGNTANYNTGINSPIIPTHKYIKPVTPAKKSVIPKLQSVNTFTQQSKQFINSIALLPTHKLSFDSKLEEGQVEPDSVKMARLILGNKRYRYDKPWIGIHLTGMMPLGAMLDSGYRPGIGMNLELMSGDILKAKYMGLSLGGSMGFLWNGQGRKQDVILATPNNDSGYTRLYNMGFHLDFIARAEFGNRRLKPYFDGVLGVRNASTFQSINSDQTIQGYQGSTNTMLTSWALQYGISAGLRWHWVPGVSVDLRGTLYSGANLNFIDVKHTAYNTSTASFTPNTHTAPGDMFVLRLGLLFDLDEMEYDHNSKNNYSTTTTYQQTNGKSTPVYDNRGNNGSSTNGSSGPRIGGSSGSSGGAPLKIKIPTPVPVKR